MKTRFLIGIGLSVGMSCAVGADEPPIVDEPLNVEVLGTFDAMLASCVQVNPAGKSAYDALQATLTGSETATDVSAARQTPEYRQAFDEARKKNDERPREAIVGECTTLVKSMAPRRHQQPALNVANKAAPKPAPKPAPKAAPKTAPKPADR